MDICLVELQLEVDSSNWLIIDLWIQYQPVDNRAWWWAMCVLVCTCLSSSVVSLRVWGKKPPALHSHPWYPRLGWHHPFQKVLHHEAQSCCRASSLWKMPHRSSEHFKTVFFLFYRQMWLQLLGLSSVFQVPCWFFMSAGTLSSTLPKL